MGENPRRLGGKHMQRVYSLVSVEVQKRMERRSEKNKQEKRRKGDKKKKREPGKMKSLEGQIRMR